jgi:hypothetical protein
MLQFEVNLIDKAKIDLKGFSDGTIETMAKKTTPHPQAQTTGMIFMGQ